MALQALNGPLAEPAPVRQFLPKNRVRNTSGDRMARKPNFNMERQERDKAKAAKKAAKLDAKIAKKEDDRASDPDRAAETIAIREEKE
ncbi:hypothetical protein [Aurantimonas sp. VKM B-3413]|uniref:hypothetical protein n=1 Tax=Aurantimonas sp. VKM B-3413 TaxID=2779401 RepID=UPI001E59EB8D|nr:hypothetical protein [Aurantimonas sp. VKM B-3413]MCB8840839.1 hypothetical protein [Aurantimonas sp. VKM B-3413]